MKLYHGSCVVTLVIAYQQRLRDALPGMATTLQRKVVKSRCLTSRAEPHHYALRALYLFEARCQSVCPDTNTPVCTRFARLDWGYEGFSLAEAGRRWYRDTTEARS